MKKREPGLKRLRKGNLGALSKNPLENLRISGWLLKRQGGGRVSGVLSYLAHPSYCYYMVKLCYRPSLVVSQNTPGHVLAQPSLYVWQGGINQ
jgi:hypothetical protein